MTVTTTSTADRAAFRSGLRAFLTAHNSGEAVRRRVDTGSGPDPAVWNQLVEQLGLSGLIVPEQFGGHDLTFAELVVALEESGRSLLAGPFLGSAVLSTLALLSVSDLARVSDQLSELSAGTAIAALALDDDEDAPVRARSDAGGWQLSGTKTRVFDAQFADRVLVVADGTQGPALFVVGTADPGVQIEPLAGLDLSRPLSRVRLSDAPATLLADDYATGLARTTDLAAIALSAELVGVAERSLEIGVQYAKDRVQFGRTIGSFQAVKHLLADSLSLIEQMRAAVEVAALQVADAGAAELRELSAVVKAYCSDAATTVVENLIQVLGGIGYTWEHPAHLYLRRAKMLGALFGDAAAHRDRLAAELGLVPE